MTFKMKN